MKEFWKHVEENADVVVFGMLIAGIFGTMIVGMICTTVIEVYG